MPAAGAVGIAALAPLVYHRMLTPGWAPVGFDILTYFEPSRHYLAQAWQQGRWIPLWDPNTFFGVPFLANIQNAALYPPSLLFAVLPTSSAIAWELALHLSIAGAGMFMYAWRAERLRAAGSLVAAAVYMLGGQMTAHLEHLNQDSTLAWTPWLMLAMDRLIVRPSAHLVAATGLLGALVILAGHTQDAYYSFIFAAVVAGGRLLPRLRRHEWRGVWRGLGAGAAAGVLGVAIAGAQLLPTLELARQGIRSSGLNVAQAGVVSLPLRGLVGYLLPDYLNQVGSEYAAYVGVAALVLAAFAVAIRWRRPRIVVLAAMALLGVWAATGPNGHLYNVLFKVVPGFDLFRAPARLLIFTIVALALLAGHGTLASSKLASACRRRRWRQRAREGLAVTAGVAGAAYAVLLAFKAEGYPSHGFWKLLSPLPDADLRGIGEFVVATLLVLLLVVVLGRRHWAWRSLAYGLPALVLLELFITGSATNMRHPLPAVLFEQRGAAASLAPVGGNARYLSLASAAATTVTLPGYLQSYGLSAADSARYVGYLALIADGRPNIGSEGTLSADGYDGGLLPLQSYIDFRAAVLPAGSPNLVDYDTADLTNKIWDPSWLFSAGVAVVVTNAGSNPNPPGCAACLVPGATADGMTAWVPRTPPSGPPSRAWVEGVAGGRTAATVVSDSGEQVRIALPTGATGHLVLSDAYYPGWTATADGRAVAITKYDGFAQEVSIPPGAREVVFSYSSDWLPMGAALSLLGLLVTLGLFVAPRLLRFRGMEQDAL
ncbi:MAG TPA: hypothetical protein VNI34_04925 [Candidatus Nitrosotalea sp.]|nr:hypothetical protein [Candidatus Nitrosotalea sp.]